MKRKWQFSLRTLIALPLLIAIGIVLFDRLWVYDESQSGTELLEVWVLDASSDAPIVGAILRSTDTETEATPKATNADGKAAFAHSYKYHRFKSLLRDRYNRVTAHSIAISAQGFQPVSIDLESHRLGKEEDYALPYPIVVRLERVPNDVRSDVLPVDAKPQNNAVNRSGESR